jgi:predicted component of type VI protein secretion system
MPPRLQSLDQGPDILLDKPILLFGRHEECDIQLNSRKISRRHCCLAQVGNRLMIRDLGSTNGVRINGQRVEEGTLKAGDELTIGNFRFTVRDDGLGPPPGGRAVEPHDQVPARPAGKRKTAVLKDEMLEQCDEPVALDDDDSAPIVVAPVARGPSAAKGPQPPPDLERSFHLSGINEAAQVIPDDLKLAPGNSDVMPRKKLEKPPPLDDADDEGDDKPQDRTSKPGER